MLSVQQRFCKCWKYIFETKLKQVDFEDKLRHFKDVSPWATDLSLMLSTVGWTKTLHLTIVDTVSCYVTKRPTLSWTNGFDKLHYIHIPNIYQTIQKNFFFFLLKIWASLLQFWNALSSVVSSVTRSSRWLKVAWIKYSVFIKG